MSYVACCCRFDIRLRGYLSKYHVGLAAASNTEDFKKTRLFKYVPLQCVTVILGPFGDNFRFLTSSEGFHHPKKTHVVTFEEVARRCVYTMSQKNVQLFTFLITLKYMRAVKRVCVCVCVYI